MVEDPKNDMAWKLDIDKEEIKLERKRTETDIKNTQFRISEITRIS